MSKIKAKFETPDGKVFNDLKDAEKHWEVESQAGTSAMDKWWKISYSALNLRNNGYILESSGCWEICGEESNADYNCPRLAIVKGTLKQAIDYAGTVPRFFTWGSGGEIRPIKIIDLSDTK